MSEPSDRPIRRRGPRAARPASRRRAGAVSAVAAVVFVGVLLGGCGSSARAAHSTSVLATGDGSQGVAALAPSVAEAPCGAAAPRTAARTVELAAEAIYRLELNSVEVRADRREVERYAPLLSALAAGDRAGVATAVRQLVYSHTHIVRLRITRAGAVVDDLGGAYSIAPVRGQLRLHGRLLGGYVLSVQDDVGYVKLEKRYIGAPLLLRAGAAAVPVEGMLRSGSPAIPDEGPVSYRGERDQAVSFDAENIPASRLKVTLLVPVPPAGLGCAAVRVFELGRITQTMWRRFVAVSAPPAAYVKSAGSLTGALMYVRAGSRQIAGSTIPGPAHLPVAGTVSYRGVLYRVTSFSAHGAAGALRVYALVAS